MGYKSLDSSWGGEMHLQCEEVSAVEFSALLLSRRQLDRGLVRHNCVLIDRVTGEAFSVSDSEILGLGSLAMR
jgi:hypothetical protein